MGCGESVPIVDGIVDFVQDSARTKLDDLDYDAFYRVSESSAHSLIARMKALAGHRWPRDGGRLIEIGAGTGGATMGLAATPGFRHVVVTDISLKMLRQCRRNLQAANLLRPDDMTFVTYGATQNCFRPESFDTAIGSCVLHHITDVEAFLGDLARLLAPGGRAFFIEPCLTFHRAITAALADIIDALLRDGWPADDIRIARMCNWVAEVRCNLLHAGDLAFLTTREDKHMFTRPMLDAMARPSGLDVDAVAFGPDPVGHRALGLYLAQCEVGDELIGRVQAMLPRYAPPHMASVAGEDLAASYLVCVSKPAAPRHESEAATESEPVLPTVPDPKPARFDLFARYTPHGADVDLALDGWIVSEDDIAWIVMRFGGETHRVPVWLPRRDVLTAFGAGSAAARVNVLCSGVSERIPMGDRAGRAVAIQFDAVTAGGARFRLGAVTLAPDGEGRLSSETLPERPANVRTAHVSASSD